MSHSSRLLSEVSHSVNLSQDFRLLSICPMLFCFRLFYFRSKSFLRADLKWFFLRNVNWSDEARCVAGMFHGGLLLRDRPLCVGLPRRPAGAFSLRKRQPTCCGAEHVQCADTRGPMDTFRLHLFPRLVFTVPGCVLFTRFGDFGLAVGLSVPKPRPRVGERQQRAPPDRSRGWEASIVQNTPIAVPPFYVIDH